MRPLSGGLAGDFAGVRAGRVAAFERGDAGARPPMAATNFEEAF